MATCKNKQCKNEAVYRCSRCGKDICAQHKRGIINVYCPECETIKILSIGGKAMLGILGFGIGMAKDGFNTGLNQIGK